MYIKFNDNSRPYFPTHKGLRQGYSLSPLIFNLAADALTMLMDNAGKNGLIKGLLTDNLEGGVNMPHYADDTIFLLWDDFDSAYNLKCILSLFDQMTGLKIKFHKTELFQFGKALDKKDDYSPKTIPGRGGLPLEYLGLRVDKKGIKMNTRNFQKKMWHMVGEAAS